MVLEVPVLGLSLGGAIPVSIYSILFYSSFLFYNTDTMYFFTPLNKIQWLGFLGVTGAWLVYPTLTPEFKASPFGLMDEEEEA